MPVAADRDPSQLENGTLTDQEKSRAATMSPERRSTFVAGRRLARFAIGESAGVAPHDVPLERQPSGKLAPLSTSAGAAYVSISHTRSHVAVLVSGAELTGVDIEDPNREYDWRRVVEKKFSEDEGVWLDQVNDKSGEASARELFFRLWTLKEAAVKAEIGNLIQALSSFAVRNNGAEWITDYFKCSLLSAQLHEEGLILGAILPEGGDQICFHRVDHQLGLLERTDLRSTPLSV